MKFFDCELQEAAVYEEKVKIVDKVLQKHSIALGTKEGLIFLALYGTMAGNF